MVFVLLDGKWSVRLLDREVATGMWRERNNSVHVMKQWGAFALTCCCGEAVTIE